MDAHFNSDGKEINLENFTEMIEDAKSGHFQFFVNEKEHKISVFKNNEVPKGWKFATIDDIYTTAERLFAHYTAKDVENYIADEGQNKKQPPKLENYTWSRIITTVLSYIEARIDSINESQTEIESTVKERVKDKFKEVASAIPVVGKAVGWLGSKVTHFAGKILSEDLKKDQETTERMPSSKIAVISEGAHSFVAKWKLELTKVERLYFNAIREGKMENLKFLTSLGINPLTIQGIYTRGVIDQSNIRGDELSPMQSAALHGKPQILAAILDSIKEAEDLKSIGGPLKRQRKVQERQNSLLVELDAQGNNLLHYAIKGGNVDTINYLAKLSREKFPFLLQKENYAGVKPLELTILAENISLLEDLLKNPHSSFKIGQEEINSLLRFSVMNKRLKSTTFLLQHASQKEINDSLINAAELRDHSALKAILPKVDSEVAKVEALKQATKQNSISMVESLTGPKNGAKLTDKLARSLAIIAVENGQVDVIQKLLPAIAEKDKNIFLDSLVTIAARNGNIKVSDSLIDRYRAKITAEAFLKAADEGQLDYIKKYAPRDFPYRYSVARHAILSGHLDILTWVIVNYKDLDFNELLEEAATHNKIDMVKFLMEFSSKAERKDIKPDKVRDIYLKLNHTPYYEIRELLWNSIPNKQRLIDQELGPPKK